jgi:hypothetical protein
VIYLYKKHRMKLSQKITLGVGIIGLVGIALLLTRQSKTRRMLNQISDEGYETAHDILFPGERISARALHYGPVIPN